MSRLVVRSHHQLTFVVLALGVGAFALLQSLTNPALPALQVALGTSQTNVTWVLTSYLLSASIFTPVLGRLGDMNGKKKMFVVALVALSLGSLLAALATSLPVMIVARVVQGVGGGVLPLAFGIIRDEFPAAKVSGAVGLIAALSAIAAGVGIILAGPIVTALDYHWLFWIPFIVTVVATVAALLVVPESRQRTPGRVNWGAASLMSGWLVALLLGVSQAPVWGWTSAAVVGLILGALVLAVVWVRVELASSNPLIDMRLMGKRAVWTTNLVALLFGVGLYGILGFLPAFLQAPVDSGYGFGASITVSGLMLLPQTVLMFVLGLMAGRLARRFGSKAMLVTGSFIGFAALMMLTFAHDQPWQIYAATALSGVGFGLAFSAMSALVVNAVPREQTGVASGMNANIRTIGGALGAAVMASVVTAGAAPSGSPPEAGYTNGFLMLAVALLLSAGAGLLIPRVRAGAEAGRGQQPSTAEQHGELAVVAGGTVVGEESK